MTQYYTQYHIDGNNYSTKETAIALDGRRWCKVTTLDDGQLVGYVAAYLDCSMFPEVEALVRAAAQLHPEVR